MKNKFILAAVGISISFLSGMILFAFLWIKEKRNSKEINRINSELVDNIKKQADDIKKQADKDINNRNLTIDSLQNKYTILQEVKYKNKIYYEKQLEYVKSINTYNRRSAYADSIERTIVNSPAQN